MAKVKVVKTSLNANLNGEYFNDTPSNTIFSFGKFFVTSNFDGKTTIDYTNSLSSFVRPVTLETLGISETQSEIIQDYNINAVLNLDKSDLNTFVRYGSAYEFLRVSVQNIILAFPGSLFANSQKFIGGDSNDDNQTCIGYQYDVIANISTFYIPTGATVNTFGLVYNNGNTSIPDDNELKNINDSYEKYVIWSVLDPDTQYTVIGYTGNTVNQSDPLQKNYLKIRVEGDPFESLGTGSTSTTTGLISGYTFYQDYHLKPNNICFEEFRAQLDSYEQNLVSERDGTNGFVFTLKNPTELEDGKIVYSDTQLLWETGDKYNVDVNTPNYQRFLLILLRIGEKYDKIKTDLIARFLTPASLKTYDFTDEGKTTKLLRLYGREFDEIRQFIDSLVLINKVSYDKLNNIPDQLIKNMARTFGWDYFSLLNESELVEGFLTIDDTERNLNDNILPAEIDVELWRRILNNTSYFWKSKGTRQAIKSIFLLIGIPEPFINITEYVYTVDGRIDPNSVELTQADFPSDSLPYDTEGYPVAPLETNDFYFQLSGNSDSGQAYLDVFRMAGFNLKQTPDNKKSWIEAGEVTRQHYSTPQYYQEDNKLIINTKEVDIALDTAQAIEWDVYEYIQKDFAANSSGYTLPYSYVNISNVPRTGNTFTIPVSDYYVLGDFEVRYNGILLNAPSTGDTSGYTTGNTVSDQADYTVNGNSFTIPELSGGVRDTDVIQVTLVESGSTSVASATNAITINYIVTRIKAVLGGTYVPLPSFPRGDVQLTINGIALTKGTPQFTADYIVDPANSDATGATNNLIISNPDVITFLNANPDVQISYMEVQGSNDINMRSEVVRVDSFNTSKIYFNNSANKYVYKLNYKVNNASEVKFLVDGIALEPYLDYSINVQNQYEIFLPRGIRYGTVISAYYLVGGAGAFNPVINDVFGLGDISELSFLEFLELVQRKMINAKNRKIVTDFKGGWYPTVLDIYDEYLKRASLPDDDPLQSNGYTFSNLYPFLNKYNAFFQKFVDQLLPATIIQKRGGLLIRNTIFTKQKHWYKRGVNVVDPAYPDFDLRGNELVQFLGGDGSTFQIIQEILPPPIPVPPELYVETTEGVLGSLITGGENIIGFDVLTKYGIDYKRVEVNDWTRISEIGSLGVNNFSITIPSLDEDTVYDYRAFVQSSVYGYTGNTRQVTTPPPPPLEPYLVTSTADSTTQTSIVSTGGQEIIRYEDIQYYAMQYRIQIGGGWGAWTTKPPATGPLGDDFWVNTITGLVENSTYEYQAYMTVDGIAYYGGSKTATTAAIPTQEPEVDTGIAVNVTTSGFLVDNNNVIDKGVPATIIQYGILFTQSSDYGTDANLRLSNFPYYVDKDSTLGDIGVGVDWDKSASGLDSNTTTYYRAYAINDTGTGYGVVKTIQTAVPPPSNFNVRVRITWTGSGVPHSGFGGIIYLREQVTNTLVDDDVFSPFSQSTDSTLIAPAGDTYIVELDDLIAWVDTDEEPKSVRWRIDGNWSWTYSQFVADIQDGINDDIIVEVSEAP